MKQKRRAKKTVAKASTAPERSTKATATTEKPTSDSKTSEDSLMGLLNRDVSWGAIRKVLNYEIPSPFSHRRAELADEAVNDSKLSKSELADIRRNRALVGDSFGSLMVERGIITADQLAEAQQFRERTEQPLWRTLLHLRMVTPQQLAKLLRMDLRIGSLPENELTEWFVKNKVVTKTKLKNYWKDAQHRNIPFLDYLRDKGLAKDEEIAQALSVEMNLPYESLEDVKDISEDALDKLPYSFPFRYHALPIRFNENTLFVAFADAEDLVELENLGILLDFHIQPVIVPKNQLSRLLRTYAPQVDLEVADEEASQYELQNEIRDKPAPELLNVVLRGILKCEGSDIHIEPQKGFYRIRYRIDGVLHDVLTLDRPSAKKVANQIKALSELDTANPMLPQDGHLIVHIEGKDINFRVSSLPTPDGEKIALRLVKTHFAFSRFEQLGMSVKQRQLMDLILNLPSGLILAAGPVGSGKTTTIYSCLNCLNPFTQNIMTIEDPVEYKLVGTTQAQVNTKVDLGFATGLRAILRQDPDMIMVGEIRDDETAHVAVSASMSGQKVFSTVHANSAPTSVLSLQLLGVRPGLIAQALGGIVFQKIVRRNCPNCSKPTPATPQFKKELGVPLSKSLMTQEGAGCPSCLHTGYHGRTCLFEILLPDDGFRSAVANGVSPEELNRAAKKSGMLTLREHAIDLLKQGVIPAGEVQHAL